MTASQHIDTTKKPLADTKFRNNQQLISGDAMATLTAPPGLEPVDAEVIEVPAGTAAGARRKLFDPHLEPEAIEDGLASGDSPPKKEENDVKNGKIYGDELFWTY